MYKIKVLAFVICAFFYVKLTAAHNIEHSLGNVNAPITIIEYSSFVCPYCAAFATQVFPKIKKKYIDTGKVRFIFKPFPIDGYIAIQTEQISDCIANSRYLEFRHALFRDQRIWLINELNKPINKKNHDPFYGMTDRQVLYFRTLSRLTGLGESQLKACLLDRGLAYSIFHERIVAQSKHGINAIPAFIVNGKQYIGFQSLQQMDSILKKILAHG